MNGAIRAFLDYLPLMIFLGGVATILWIWEEVALLWRKQKK
jgi:hypothetical protein